ncbi:MAG TPA: hypothetical protein VGO40_24810 [Longimicrobium sp.]|jgi:uncharacterized membrane protein|nr:hypothetical protein [Longimicrobium sp.]
MTPREKAASPADPPPPARTPFDAALETTALIHPSSAADGEPRAGEAAAESASCPFCGGEVTPRDERCPRCAAKVVPPGSKPIEKMRGKARTVYLLQALALLCGVTAIPGLLLAYANRGAARDTWLDSHCEWQIDTVWGMFWFWLCGMAVLFVGDHFLGRGLPGHGPALLVMLGGYAWYIARLVKGWTRLSDGDPVTDY